MQRVSLQDSMETEGGPRHRHSQRENKVIRLTPEETGCSPMSGEYWHKDTVRTLA